MSTGKKFVITWLDVLAVIVVGMFLLDVAYVEHIANVRPIKLLMFGVFGGCGLFCIHNQKIVILNEYIILLSDALFILLVTLVYRGSITVYIKDFGSIISVCFLIVACRRKKDIIRCFRIICLVFLVLTVIDLASMVIWPNGMYAGTYINNNFFLGYKTARLNYTFSLLLLYTYIELLQNGVLTWRFVCLAGLVSVNAIMSKGSGAAVAVIGFAVAMFLIFFQSDHRIDLGLRELVQKILCKYIVIISIWLIVNVVVLFGSSTELVMNFIRQAGKEFSYGERVVAWIGSFAAIKENWLIGIGIQARETIISLTGGFANCHNTLFTYWLTGGLFGMTLLAIVFAAAFHRTSAKPVNYAMTMYVYCILFMGITSSFLAFSPFLFAALLLAFKEFEEDEAVDPAAIGKYFKEYGEIGTVIPIGKYFKKDNEKIPVKPAAMCKYFKRKCV